MADDELDLADQQRPTLPGVFLVGRAPVQLDRLPEPPRVEAGAPVLAGHLWTDARETSVTGSTSLPVPGSSVRARRLGRSVVGREGRLPRSVDQVGRQRPSPEVDDQWARRRQPPVRGAPCHPGTGTSARGLRDRRRSGRNISPGQPVGKGFPSGRQGRSRDRRVGRTARIESASRWPSRVDLTGVTCRRQRMA